MNKQCMQHGRLWRISYHTSGISNIQATPPRRPKRVHSAHLSGMTSFPEGVAGTSRAPHTHPLILVTSDCHEEGHKPSQPHFQPRMRLPHFLARSKKPDSPSMIASEPKPLHEDRPVSHSEIATHVTSPARPAEPPVEIPKPQRTPILADTSRHAGRVKDPVSISPSHGCENAKRAHLYESIRQNGRTTEGFESSCFENEYHNEYSTRGSTCGSTDSFSARTDRTSSYGPLTHPKSFDVGGLSDAEAEASSFSLSLDGLSINEATTGRSEGSPASFDVQLYTDSIIHSAHEIEVTAESPRMLYGFQRLLGKRLEFLKVKTLSDGNGTASLEVVISSNIQQLGMGFADGSLFVLKRFKADQIGEKTKMRRDSWRQLNRECTAYRRIAEVSVCRRQGLEFVMTIEATLTLIDQNSTLDRGDSRSLCLLLVSFF